MVILPQTVSMIVPLRYEGSDTDIIPESEPESDEFSMSRCQSGEASTDAKPKVKSKTTALPTMDLYWTGALEMTRTAMRVSSMIRLCTVNPREET